MIFIKFIFIELFFCLCSLSVWAETPEVELRQMIGRDMVGDPTGRMGMAASGAFVVVAQSRQLEQQGVTFDIEGDAIEIATEWHLADNPDLCSKTECIISVVYRVVATTSGYGEPSWDREKGREIVPLEKPTDRLVSYKFLKQGEDWKIREFPPPYVTPQLLIDYFSEDIEKMRVLKFPIGINPQAIRNRDVILMWEQRQIDILKNLSR